MIVNNLWFQFVGRFSDRCRFLAFHRKIPYMVSQLQTNRTIFGACSSSLDERYDFRIKERNILSTILAYCLGYFYKSDYIIFSIDNSKLVNNCLKRFHHRLFIPSHWLILYDSLILKGKIERVNKITITVENYTQGHFQNRIQIFKPKLLRNNGLHQKNSQTSGIIFYSTSGNV